LPILFYRVATTAAVPFLALFGFMFLCVRTILAATVRLVGWHLAWPPVLVDGEPPPDSHRTRSMRSRTSPVESRRSGNS